MLSSVDGILTQPLLSRKDAALPPPGLAQGSGAIAVERKEKAGSPRRSSGTDHPLRRHGVEGKSPVSLKRALRRGKTEWRNPQEAGKGVADEVGVRVEKATRQRKTTSPSRLVSRRGVKSIPPPFSKPWEIIDL